MATKKDLVEAHAFSRRRLVTAFLSGAPGGREVEPSRPGRTIVGGVALAVLLVAGAAIASVLAGRNEAEWNKPGLVASEERTTPYLILEEQDPPFLVPLLNVTSAQLILGADTKPTYVDQETLNQQRKGDYIGIFGAPSELPDTDSFIQTGWTACTGDDLGLAVDVDEEPSVTRLDPREAFLVRSEGSPYVIAVSDEDASGARAYRYPVPDGPGADNMLRELGLEQRAQAVDVPPEWLALFPAGGALGFETFGLTGFGTPVPGGTVGQYVETADGGALVLTLDGPVPLSEFAFTVYRRSLVPGTADQSPTPAPSSEVPPGQQGADLLADAHWPAGTLDTARGELCAVLDLEPGEVPAAVLAGDPTGDASAEALSDPAGRDINVQLGHGAYVASGDWFATESAAPYVLTAQSEIFPLQGLVTLDKLGYDDVDAPVVPDSWIELFGRGVPLSTSRALCPPAPAPAPDQVCEEQ